MTQIPYNYKSNLTVIETEVAIKKAKDYFQNALAKKLNLTRVSAPLFILPNSGLNDNLNGVERPVSFDIKELENEECEIVHSLAKWKRLALKKYGFKSGQGLYTDMNAIRRDEDTDNIHSIYVDQWDWEAIISKHERTVDTLKKYVNSIYDVLIETENYICREYDFIEKSLPESITYITTQELLDKYPNLSAKDREKEIVRKYKAIFLMNIGGKLSNGKPHDGRAPDYDDWSLNGDIILYYPLLDISYEISSMGIRVDKTALSSQLNESGHNSWMDLAFHKSIFDEKLPYTIGGGIGQSRLCMYFLKKAHIGEVQSSVWPNDTLEVCKNNNINLL